MHINLNTLEYALIYTTDLTYVGVKINHFLTLIININLFYFIIIYVISEIDRKSIKLLERKNI